MQTPEREDVALIAGTRWKRVLRESLGMLHRELKVTLTPVPRPEKWVFVVGCYNSGTTLLAQILGGHGSISALPDEGQFLTDQFAADHELGLSRMWVRREDLYRLTEADAGPEVVRLKKEWGMRLDRTKPVLLEKSPPNAARTRWLQRHFENAHFVGIVRNGYAVAEGIRRKAKPPHSAEGWPLSLCTRQWVRSNELLEADSGRLRRFMWVRYEDLTQRPEREILRILNFLDLDPDPDLDLTETWSVHERREPIRDLNEESIRNLSSEDIRIINGIAADTLHRFGYELLAPDRIARSSNE